MILSRVTRTALRVAFVLASFQLLNGSSSVALEPPLATKLPGVSIDDLLAIADPVCLQISPDGQYVVYLLEKPDVSTDDYGVDLFMARADGEGMPLRILSKRRPRPGEHRGNGCPVRWSPDSQHVSYVSESTLETAIVDYLVSDGRSRTLVSGLPNATLMGWSADSSAVFYSVVRPLPQTPWHSGTLDPAIRYDGGVRINAVDGWRGRARVSAEHDEFRINVRDCVVHQLTHEQFLAMLPPSAPVEHYPQTAPLWNTMALEATLSPDRHLSAFITQFVVPETKTQPPIYRGRALSVREVGSTGPPRHLYRDDDLSLDDAPVWSGDGKRLFVLHRDLEYTVLLSVELDDGVTREVYRTTNYLGQLSWDSQRKRVAAISQTASRPPEVVCVELLPARSYTVHRPNAYLDSREIPGTAVQRIINKYGHDMAVRITLPNDYVAGRRYPVIATTYVSHNRFQRGAVGDEFPIFPFASHGFVVVSLHDGPDTLASSERGNLDVSIVRQLSPLDTLVRAIDELAREGVVDWSMSGITGLSYGAEIVHFALITNTPFRVAAAATAAGVWSTIDQFVLEKEWLDREFELRGLPFPDDEAARAWHRVAVELNAHRIRMPLLLQPSDREALFSLPAFHAFRHARVPVDMYVYQNEGHVKEGPRSKFWVYQRNLDWMRFWLQGVEDPSPEKRAQYQLWREMQATWQQVPAAKPPERSELTTEPVSRRRER